MQMKTPLQECKNIRRLENQGNNFVSFLTPHPEVLEHFLTLWLLPELTRGSLVSWQLFSENEPTSWELHTFYKASSSLLELPWQESVQGSVCYWHQPFTCAGVSQTVKKWRKYQNSPALPQFWSLLLDTTALWFQWFYLFKNLMLLNKAVNSSKHCFTCQCSPNSCYRQYSCLIIIYECSTEPSFFVSTNVREMAPFSRAESVFV